MFPDPIVGCAFPACRSASCEVWVNGTNIHNGYVTQIIWSKIVIVENAIVTAILFSFFPTGKSRKHPLQKIDIVFADGVIYRRFGCVRSRINQPPILNTFLVPR
jgi:hypothetical protein